MSAVCGLDMGAQQVQRADKGYRIGLGCSVAFLFAGGMILSRPSISTAIVSIFADDPAVIALAADFLATMAFWCWTNGVHDASMGLFQGTGHTEVTMAINISRIWVLRFATLWFCESVLHLGVRSIWYSVVLSNGLASLILVLLYTTGIWRKSRIKVNK